MSFTSRLPSEMHPAVRIAVGAVALADASFRVSGGDFMMSAIWLAAAFYFGLTGLSGTRHWLPARILAARLLHAAGRLISPQPCKDAERPGSPL